MASPRKAEKAAKSAKAKRLSRPQTTPAKNGQTKSTNGKAAGKAQGGRKSPDIANADPVLFDPLTPGEAADALRTLTEDKRLVSMAKVGRYRVICTEPLVVKPPHWMAGHRLARVVAYDYAADRCVDACVDLDAGVVAHLELTKAQPMLSLDEEALAISVAMADERVIGKLGMGEGPQSTMHYWGRTQADIAFTRRSAAVIFGRQGGHATLIAVVDLLDNQVTRVVPAEMW
jgi:Cu2+-containing amine oxidase